MMIDELLGDEQKQLRRTRLTLRVILTQLTACAVIATGFCVGAVAYLNSQATVQKLAGEVFSMEADYTYARVVEYSHAARHVLDLNVGLLRH